MMRQQTLMRRFWIKYSCTNIRELLKYTLITPGYFIKYTCIFGAEILKYNIVILVEL